MIGKTVSQYQITAELGRGGMGIVYQATDTKLGREVALKFLAHHLTDDPVSKDRFLREARAAAILRHDAICAIYEVGESDDGHTFIVMPYYEGQTLKEVMGEGPISENRARHFIRQIAGGLKAAHEKGLVHRDIKPGNILITENDGLKILDFGLAKLTGDIDITAANSTVGTMAYMSPEQVQNGKVDDRSDLWSTGVLLFEMLTGEKPFSGTYEAAVVYGIVNQPLELDDDRISESIRPVLTKLLEKDPERRVGSAGELISQLEGGDVGTGVTSRPTAPSSGSFFSSVDPIRAGLVAVLVLVVGFGVWSLLMSGGGDENSSVSQTVTSAGGLPTVAVMYVENNTERERLGYVLQDMLARNLGQVDSLSVVSNQRLKDILRQEIGEDFERIDARTASNIARQAGVETMIIAAVVQFGEQYVLEAELTDVESGNIIDAVSVTAPNEAGIMTAVNELTSGILSGSGKFASSESGLLRIQDVSTENLTAYEYFEKGQNDMNEWRFEQATQNFMAAIQIDSTFVAAYAAASVASSVFSLDPTDGIERSREFMAQASRHLDRASEADRDMVEFQTHALSWSEDRGESSRAMALAAKYPDDKAAQFTAAMNVQGATAYEYFSRLFDLDPSNALGYNMIAYYYMRDGEVEEAVSHVRRYRALQPDIGNTMDSAWEIMTGVGEEEEAIAALDDAALNGVATVDVSWRKLISYGVMGDTTSAWSELRVYEDVVNTPALLVPYRGSHLAMIFGQWERARVLSAAHLREARRTRSDAEQLVHLRNHATILHASGHHQEAEAILDEMVEISRSVYTLAFNPIPVLAAYENGLGYADAGDIEGLDRAIEAITEARDVPGLDRRHSRYVYLLRAHRALLNGELEQVRELAPLIHDFVPYPHETRILARAEGLSGNTSAALHLYSLLEHNVSARGFNVQAYSSFFIDSSIALYEKARMYDDRGDLAEAITAYEEALERWRNTGATFRFVELAESRLAELK